MAIRTSSRLLQYKSQPKRFGLCNSCIGHGGPRLRCGLLHNHCSDLRTRYDHLLRYLRVARVTIASQSVSFRRYYRTKLTSNSMRKGQEDRKVSWPYTTPRMPMHNALVERFTGRIREECRNEQLFPSLRHAAVHFSRTKDRK